MKLYNFANATNPRRVRMFLAEKGIEVPMVTVDLMKGEHRTAEFLARDPAGRLPLLELDDGSFLSESVAICRYFDAIQPEPPLFGRNGREIAEIEMWQRRAELELYLPISNAFRHSSPAAKALQPVQVAEWAALCRERAAECMGWIDARLADRDYLAGEMFSIADITAFCALGLGTNTRTIEVASDLENLQRWRQIVGERPSATA
ncbi:MAG TPA: glutathione S-transferase [Alphaproteobacteria bacterium]|jgi:glutathione S-transferase|nr:glutathione S-transferase [Alphaproteobacteria bacterium]HBC53876.1 glutathione S-transferase [Alphaproteobacteria bacterium]HBF97238.1 glutathione S-transferase [Alphaproteobacteria bacterium]